jgi:menaquinone-dependent protoporphyrinogen oxidase
MKVLVAYASKAGSTKGIAEFIGERLRERGIQTDVYEVSSVRGLEEYDAFVIGSAVYMFHWIKEAKQFVLKNRATLGGRPVWLFSSGPVGLQKTNPKGQDLTDASVSGPKEIDELSDAVKPRDHHVFFGALSGDKLGGAMGLTYRFMKRSKAVRESMPDGDYRDWKDIEAWANRIADALTLSTTNASTRQ